MAGKTATKTQESLLAAASEVFANKGFRDATIAEICELAGTNIASVNYHFGDKETLYREAWRHSFLKSLKEHPPDGGAGEDEPPEDRLRGMVKALLERITDESNREFVIVFKELANPTGLLEEVMREALRPLQVQTAGVVRELLGQRASAVNVRFCEISIISQCIHPMLMRRLGQINQNAMDCPSRIDDVEAYADHLVEFSLAGIRAIGEKCV